MKRVLKQVPLIPYPGLLNYAVKYLYFLILGTIIVASIELSSCKNTLTPGISNIVFPDTGSVHYPLVQQLFNYSCNYSGCHDHADQAGGLDLSYYDSWITDPGVIIPGDTAHSTLVLYIEGTYYHDPSLVSVLTPNQIEGLKRWIEEGAPPD